MSGERTITKRVSDDGERLIIIERWLDRQHSPARWPVEEPSSEAQAERDRVLPAACSGPVGGVRCGHA